MRRILFVSPISTAGGPVYVLEKILERVSQLHEVAVLAPGNGVLFQIAARLSIPAYHTSPRGLRWSAIPWLCKLIVQQDFHIVYSNSFRSGPRNALIAAKLTRRKTIWHINELLKGPRQVNRKNAFFLKFADGLIADAFASQQAIQQYVPHKTVEVIYNGIATEEFDLEKNQARLWVRDILGIPPDAFVVLNAGLICERKGQEYSLHAAIEVLKTHPQTHFVFLGDESFAPEYAQKLKEMVCLHHLERHIHFMGFREDFAHFAVGADVFLHTAVRDPFPLVILGAMAAGIPVVAFDIAGVNEQVVDGVSGFLYPVEDISGVAEGLRRCLDSAQLCQQLGLAGQQRVQERFSARAMTEGVLRVIDKVARG